MAYYNGFHDASNAISTAITTRSLPESTALAMAAILNLLGALLGLLVITVSAQWALQLLGLTRLAEATSADPDLLGWALVSICRSEEHTSELQSRGHLVCRLLLEKKNKVSDMETDGRR